MNSERLQQLQQFLEKMPNDAFTLYSIAYEYMQAGDVPTAMEFFARLHAADPDYVGLYYHWGKCYGRLDNYKEAIKVYEQGLEVATRIGDRHAHSELQRARQQAQDELEDW